MATPVLDPSLPADNSPILLRRAYGGQVVSGELRGQFQAILDPFARPGQVLALNLTVSNPPTEAEVQAIADKLDELIGSFQ